MQRSCTRAHLNNLKTFSFLYYEFEFEVKKIGKENSYDEAVKYKNYCTKIVNNQNKPNL